MIDLIVLLYIVRSKMVPLLSDDVTTLRSLASRRFLGVGNQGNDAMTSSPKDYLAFICEQDENYTEILCK